MTDDRQIDGTISPERMPATRGEAIPPDWE
jgi:hypothetical protein